MVRHEELCCAGIVWAEDLLALLGAARQPHSQDMKLIGCFGRGGDASPVHVDVGREGARQRGNLEVTTPLCGPLHFCDVVRKRV